MMAYGYSARRNPLRLRYIFDTLADADRGKRDWWRSCINLPSAFASGQW